MSDSTASMWLSFLRITGLHSVPGAESFLDGLLTQHAHELVEEIKASKEIRDQEFYPYFPESYEAEEDGWQRAMNAIDPDWCSTHDHPFKFCAPYYEPRKTNDDRH